jgi:uncharacterized protein (DUF1501 family)
MESCMHTRREFLRRSVLGGALTWSLPAFLQATIETLYAAQDGSRIAAPTGKDAPVLVVLQLSGGNDGLNTVVPVGNDFYHRARPSLAIRDADALRLEGGVGLNPVLTGLKDLYDRGELAVVQGVGYPNPNRSHFRSMEIWHTASDADRFDSTGWIGRYFDNQCGGMDATAGVSIGKESPQAFASRHPKGVTFERPESYRFLKGSFDAGGGDPEDELFRQFNGMERMEGADNAGGSIGELSGRGRQKPEESPVDFLERTALDAQVSSDLIRGIAAKFPDRGGYPTTRLGQDLALVGKLIAGGMSTRVYYVSQGGFDTHTNQKGAQDRLLGEVGNALKAFVDDLREQGNLPRVTMMTFSEFGRRVAENASKGTDHGAAAPMLIAGGGVKGGLHGAMPGLDPRDLVRGDLKFGVDFRSVYATLLEKRLRADSARVLGRSFPLVDGLV